MLLLWRKKGPRETSANQFSREHPRLHGDQGMAVPRSRDTLNSPFHQRSCSRGSSGTSALTTSACARFKWLCPTPRGIPDLPSGGAGLQASTLLSFINAWSPPASGPLLGDDHLLHLILGGPDRSRRFPLGPRPVPSVDRNPTS